MKTLAARLVIKQLYLFSFVLLAAFSGCSHSPPPDPNIRTPITLAFESIKSNGSISSQSFSEDTVALLEKTLDDIASITRTKGISAAVGIPDKGFWYATRGKTGNPLREDVTPDLKFCTGSIGKIFTAVVIFSLIEERQLNLESPVVDWLPEMTYANDMKIHHLLAHTSGIAGFDNIKEYESHKDLYRNPIEVLLHIKNKRLLFDPGQHFAYSNINYLMLGIIIERITGHSYKQAVEEHILRKMDLQETDAMTFETLKNLIVRGHHHGNVITETDEYTIPFAAGSILASPRDLVLFLQALMGGRLLSEESLQTIFSEMSLMDASGMSYYGKGIVAAPKTPVGLIIGHRGGIRGFWASLYYHPEKNMFVCVMMNDDIESSDPAVFRLMEAMIEF